MRQRLIAIICILVLLSGLAGCLHDDLYYCDGPDICHMQPVLPAATAEPPALSPVSAPAQTREPPR